MKKHCFVLFAILTSSLLLAQDYLNFEGKIGKTPVTLSLKKVEEIQNETPTSVWQGSYYQNDEEIPMALYQNSAAKDALVLVKYDADDKKETFSGQFQKGVYSGIWTKNGESIPFKFKEKKCKKFTEMFHYSQKKIVPLDFIKGAENMKGTFVYDFYLPKNAEMQQMIFAQLFEGFSNFEEYVQAHLELHASEYKMDAQEYFDVFPIEEEAPMSWNHEKYQYFSPYLENSKYLTFSLSGYQYTGGAHGISYEHFMTYDKKQKKFINLSDVLNMELSAQIENTINAAIRAKHQIPENQALNASEDSIFLVEKAEISENFTLSKKGITFHYGLYDLTPYVYGYYDIFIPYSDLTSYLKSGFKY